MAPEQWEQVKEQFDVVVHLDAEARAQAFAQLQGKDPALCAQVKELVANDEQAGDFLTEPLIFEEVPRFNAGEIISGRYRIERFIGRGGMGEVYEAYDTELGERLALKTIIPHAALDERYVARLLREVRLARRVANRHVCRVHDIGHHDAPWGRICFYTMELLEGETLAERLSRCRRMSTGEALPLIEQMAEALQAAHAENIIHRDFKPGNIMLVDEKGHTRVVVTDFGLARSADATQTLHTTAEGGSPPGTMGYIAPELFQPGAVATVASDIYSFGMVIRDMVAGHHSAGADSARQSRAPLDTRWENAIRRCLEHDPERRFKCAWGVFEALRPQSIPSRLFVQARKHPLFATIAAVLLAVLVATPPVTHWLVKPQTITELRQITDDSGLSDFPSVSHDGKLLVYASDRESTGNLNLYLRQVDGDVRPIRLTHDVADDYDASFSADDTKIIFRSDRDGGGVYLMPTFGGEPQLVVKRGLGPSFSPDGRWIAYWVGSPGSGFLPGTAQAYVKPTHGGPARPIGADLVASCWPVWAPDSKRLVLIGRQDTKQSAPESVDWWVVPFNDGPAVKTSALKLLSSEKLKPPLERPLEREWITPLAWLPGQSQILFSATQGDTTNLWEIPVSMEGKATGPAVRSTFTTLIDLHASVVAEANGASRRMFFSSLVGKVNIWGLPIDPNLGQVTGAISDLTPGMPYTAVPSISREGVQLAFIAARSNTWSVRSRDLQTGREETLTSADASWLRPRISPDGNAIAYVDNSDQMYLVNRVTGITEKVCDRCGPPTDISSDGQKILFEPLNPPEDVMMIDVPSHRISSLVHSDRADHILYVGRLSPDVHWVAFTAELDNSPNMKLFISPIRNGHGVGEQDWIPITDGLQVDANEVWSPDGNLLYFLSERDGFRCVWAQRLVPGTKQPYGPAFAVQHFHNARESLTRVGRQDLVGLSIARDRLVFSLSELTGNIWMEERKTVR